MNRRLTRLGAVLIVLTLLPLISCSGVASPVKGSWKTTPPFDEVDDSICTIRITPQQDDTPYYAFFLLSVVNKGDEELAVDWNTSRYLFGGKPQGKLVFEGIDPKAVKNNTVPLETVPVGGRLERKIMPMRLIAWNPLRDKTVDARSITPGMLPAGDNGIRLALHQAGTSVTIPLSVFLFLEKRR